MLNKVKLGPNWLTLPELIRIGVLLLFWHTVVAGFTV